MLHFGFHHHTKNILQEKIVLTLTTEAYQKQKWNMMMLGFPPNSAGKLMQILRCNSRNPGRNKNPKLCTKNFVEQAAADPPGPHQKPF